MRAAHVSEEGQNYGLFGILFDISFIVDGKWAYQHPQRTLAAWVRFDCEIAHAASFELLARNTL